MGPPPPVPTVVAEVPAEAEVDASLGLTKSEEAPALDRPALLRIFRDATARGMASGEPVELVGSSTDAPCFIPCRVLHRSIARRRTAVELPC